MSLANVHNFHQNTGQPVVPGSVGGPWALIRLSTSNGQNSKRFPTTGPAVTTTAATTPSNLTYCFACSSRPSNAELTLRSPEWESGRFSSQWQGFRAIGWRLGIFLDTITPVGDPTPYRWVDGSGQMSQSNAVISPTSESPPRSWRAFRPLNRRHNGLWTNHWMPDSILRENNLTDDWLISVLIRRAWRPSRGGVVVEGYPTNLSLLRASQWWLWVDSSMGLTNVLFIHLITLE